jgi:hypothetical protein
MRDVLHEYLQQQGVIMSKNFKGAHMAQIQRMWNDNPQQQVM